MEMMGGFFVVWLLFLVVEIVLVVSALIDVARRPMDAAMKVVWVLVIVAFPIIGSIAELIVNRTGTATTV